ncbi:hypothetical protein [Tenacibaculum phage PTm5]|nr:hypothetical protein [Tenacibaculum phage PTm5]
MFDLLSKPKDWEDIAKCVSENPNHEHFGKSVQDILDTWQSKSKKGADRGMTLDRYIIAKINGITLNVSTMDEAEQKKCKQFDLCYDSMLSKIPIIGQEIWLNSRLGLKVRLDALFTIPNSKNQPSALIIDWKNNENISMTNKWQMMQGTLKGIEECDINKMTLQTHIYRYILDEYGIFNDIRTRVFQFTTEEYKIHKESFMYDKDLIERTVKYCFKELERRENKG